MGTTVSRADSLEDLRNAGDPRFLTPRKQTYATEDVLTVMRHRGTEAVFGRKPPSINSDEVAHEYIYDAGDSQSDGPEDESGDEPRANDYSDPWGRPVNALINRKNPFAARDIKVDEFGNRKATGFRDTPRRRPGNPYRRKLPTFAGPIQKNVAPDHVGGRYNITTLIDECLRKDPFADNRDFDDFRAEVEFQFGERPPPPPPSPGPAPEPEDAVYDFSELGILFKGGRITPIMIPHKNIRSPICPQRGTDEEIDLDYDRVNNLSSEACASWWIASVLWFLGEDDSSLATVATMIKEGNCPADAFPHNFGLDDRTDYEYELSPLSTYESLRKVGGRPDPVENSIWVPKLKGVKGSAVRFMRPPFPGDGKLDSRFSPIPALQSTKIPTRYDLGFPELELWDGIPGHTFRLPPYYWPEELKEEHVNGTNTPFSIDIRRIGVKLPNGTSQPPPLVHFRPTRRLNTVYRDRKKIVPLYDPNSRRKKRKAYDPEKDSPTRKSRRSHMSSQLGARKEGKEEDPTEKSFIQDEYEYETQGDPWGATGGFEGRDYKSERQRDHDKWYRYFLVNTDRRGRSILVNSVVVEPNSIAGPLPAFAILEFNGQVAFWFGVGGRDWDPNTEVVQSVAPAKRKAGDEVLEGGDPSKNRRTVRPKARYAARTPTAVPGQFVSPVSVTAAGLRELQLTKIRNPPVPTSKSRLRGDAKPFVPQNPPAVGTAGLQRVQFKKPGEPLYYPDADDGLSTMKLRGGGSPEPGSDLSGESEIDSESEVIDLTEAASLEEFSTPELLKILRSYRINFLPTTERSLLIQEILEIEEEECRREVDRLVAEANAARRMDAEDMIAQDMAMEDMAAKYMSVQDTEESESESGSEKYNIPESESFKVLGTPVLLEILEDHGICYKPTTDRPVLIQEVHEIERVRGQRGFEQVVEKAKAAVEIKENNRSQTRELAIYEAVDDNVQRQIQAEVGLAASQKVTEDSTARKMLDSDSVEHMTTAELGVELEDFGVPVDPLWDRSQIIMKLSEVYYHHHKSA